MKKIVIILLYVLAAFVSCSKSKESYPEYGDGNDEIVSVGVKEVHVKYKPVDMLELQKVVFHYGLAEEHQFDATEMTKRDDFFELSLDHLLSDTLYCYYYEIIPNNGSPVLSEERTFHTLIFDNSDPLVDLLPVVLTTEITEVYSNSANCGGEVTSNGGSEIIERGVCWSITEKPTLYNRHTIVDNGIGTFIARMDGLRSNTKYYVCAYATNQTGTAYGTVKEFTTPSIGNSEAPIGAINGLFTINENGDQVYFSQGNLRYQASTNTWQFPEFQYYCCNAHNDNISPDYDGFIDLFGWGTSGYNHGAVCFQPWSLSEEPSDYYAYGQDFYDLSDCSGRADWGYNAIENGGNLEGIWRTLTKEEWDYLINGRNTPSGIRFVKATVANVYGLLLLPDDWNDLYYTLNDVNQHNATYESNVIPNSEFNNSLEAVGAVFLPAAQYRDGTNWVNSLPSGFYWSASSGYDPYASCLFFRGYDDGTNTNAFLITQYCNMYRRYGMSVRLVQDAR